MIPSVALVVALFAALSVNALTADDCYVKATNLATGLQCYSPIDGRPAGCGAVLRLAGIAPCQPVDPETTTETPTKTFILANPETLTEKSTQDMPKATEESNTVGCYNGDCINGSGSGISSGFTLLGYLMAFLL